MLTELPKTYQSHSGGSVKFSVNLSLLINIFSLLNFGKRRGKLMFLFGERARNKRFALFASYFPFLKSLAAYP